MGVGQSLHARSEKVVSYTDECIVTVLLFCELHYCNTRISRFLKDDDDDAPLRSF